MTLFFASSEYVIKERYHILLPNNVNIVWQLSNGPKIAVQMNKIAQCTNRSLLAFVGICLVIISEWLLLTQRLIVK